MFLLPPDLSLNRVDFPSGGRHTFYAVFEAIPPEEVLLEPENSFTRQIDAALQRLETLKTRARGSADLRPLLNEALDHLGTVLEALRVTQEEVWAQAEELRAHNDELVASRQVVEAERQRYHDLFDFAPDGYLVTDLQGVIQEANAAAIALLRLREDRLKGRPLSLYVAADGKAALYKLLRHLQQTGETVVDWQLPLQPRAGAAFPASVTVGVVRPSPGQPGGLRWLLRDITARERAERQLRDRTAQLRQVTGELTLAEERERQRLALVLHDEFQQLLVGMRLVVSPLTTAEDPKAREIGQEIGDLARRCLQVSRTLSEDLSPPVMHPGGLVPALRWLVRWAWQECYLNTTASPWIGAPSF